MISGTILVLFVLIAISLVLIILIKPSLTVTQGGKIFAFVSLFIFPVLAAMMGTSTHIEHSKSTQFCLSCHVMHPYGRSLHVDDSQYLAASHYQNNRVPRSQACYTCHTDYTLYGDLHSKLRGLKHLSVQYFGTIPKKVKLYNPYNNRECLHCHAGARSFEEGATHNEEPDRRSLIRTNKLSCISSGCHSVVHNVDTLDKVKFWNENNQ
jgi:nitrate/TMAO reductase-like tetraheme cytochrome c subunit